MLQYANIRKDSKTYMLVVLNLGSIEPKGFEESDSGFSCLPHTIRMARVKFIVCWYCSLSIVIFSANDAWHSLCTNSIIY